MDFNDYWQENKRFVYTVIAGLIAFLIGYSYLSGHFGGEIATKQRLIDKHKRELNSGLFSKAELALAEEDNVGLQDAVQQLEQGLAFQPRASFKLTEGLTPANHYLRALADVRDELLPRANRASVRVEEGFGMPKMSPTQPDQIERYLEALDVVSIVLDAAVDAKVKRVEKMQVRLDPGLTSKAGVGHIEKTRVKMRLVGDTVALASVLSAMQRPQDGRAIPLGQIEMFTSKQRDDEVQMDVTFFVVRLHKGLEEELEG